MSGAFAPDMVKRRMSCKSKKHWACKTKTWKAFLQASLDSLIKERCSFWPTELLQSTRQEEWGFKVRILQVQASKTINRRRSTQTSHHFSLQCCLARFVSGQYVKNPSYPAVWPHPPSAENSQFLPAWLASIICKTSPRVKMTAQFWLSPKAAQDAARSRRSTAVPPASWYGDGWGVHTIQEWWTQDEFSVHPMQLGALIWLFHTGCRSLLASIV